LPTCTPDPSGTLCTPCNNPVGDNNEENDPTNIIEYETTHIDSKVDDNSELEIFPEFDTESIVTEVTMDSDRDDFKLTYAVLNEMSNKIVLFPELKQCIEANFLCKQCLFAHGLSGISASTLSVWQDTYGIATVVKISCGNHHMIEIIPEHLNNKAPRHSTKTFVLNYILLIIMQLLGK